MERAGAEVMLGGISAALLVRFSLTRYVAERVAGSATPGTIGAIRVLVFALLAVIASEFGLALAVLPAVHTPRRRRHELVLRRGTGSHRLKSADHERAAMGVCCAALLAMIGFQCRWTLPLATLLYLPLAGIDRSYFWVSHAGLVPFYAAVVLCFVRSGDGWSVDRWMRIRRGEPVPPKEVATSYYGGAADGVARYPRSISRRHEQIAQRRMDVVGREQHAAVALRRRLATVRRIAGDEAVWLPPIAFAFVGIMTLVCELGVISILFSRRCGASSPDDVCNALWHLSGDGDHFLGLMCLQVVFYDWTPVGRWIQRRISDEAAREPVTTRIIAAASRMRYAPFAAT